MIKFLSILSILFIQFQAYSCTIFSGKDNSGQVWVGNNEDWLFTFKSYLNIVPKINNSLGYVYFTYNHPNLDQQGGVNEAGLFFNFNYISSAPYNRGRKKEYYPGGTFKMFEYILSHCTTVHEVMDLFKKYRLDNLQSSQLHIADKFGNLGVIAGDSMRITQSQYQVSTNYNIFYSDQNQVEEPCWRMPIAQRILKNNEPSFESFRKICDSTHQHYPNGAGTIYSDIHNLSTGDIWLYHGLDFNKAFKTNIHELLTLGDTSIFIYDFFRDQKLVTALKMCEQEKYLDAIATINSINDSTHRSEILSCLATGLIEMGGMFNSYPIYEEYFNNIKPEIADIVNKSIILYCNNRKEEAFETLDKFLLIYPNNRELIQQKNRLNGQFDRSCNYKIELKGYENAKNIVIDNFWLTKTNGFMTKIGDNWIIELQMYPGNYYFAFYVDGERIVSPHFKQCTFNKIPYNIKHIGGIAYLFSMIKTKKIKYHNRNCN